MGRRKKLDFGFILLGILLVLPFGEIYSQNPFEITLFNESTSVPFSSIVMRPLHAGVQVGTEIPWHESEHHKAFLAINLRYIFHKKLYQAIAINLELSYDHKADFGMNLKTGIGIGYMHSFNVKEEYRFKNGTYVPKSDRGNSRFAPSLSFGLGYRFDAKDFRSDEIYAKQQYWLELPYSPGFIPLMSHANSMIGAKFY